MITKTTSYQVRDQFFATLEQAQRAEILTILTAEGVPDGMSPLDAAATIIVANAAKVLDILSTTAKSRPRARKANGATRKPRNSKPAVPVPVDAAGNPVSART